MRGNPFNTNPVWNSMFGIPNKNIWKNKARPKLSFLFRREYTKELLWLHQVAQVVDPSLI